MQRPVSGARSAGRATAVAVVAALCASCAGPGVRVPAAAPVATRQLPAVQPAQQEPLSGFVDGPQGPTAILPSTYMFTLNSAVIRPAADAELRSLLPAIQARTGQVLVYGWTDGLGTVERNAVLAQERADSVAQWLISNHVDRQRVIARGMGEAAPAVKPAERRVEIVLK